VRDHVDEGVSDPDDVVPDAHLARGLDAGTVVSAGDLGHVDQR
jgi:hypothetical protein